MINLLAISQSQWSNFLSHMTRTETWCEIFLKSTYPMYEALWTKWREEAWRQVIHVCHLLFWLWWQIKGLSKHSNKSSLHADVFTRKNVKQRKYEMSACRLEQTFNLCQINCSRENSCYNIITLFHRNIIQFHLWVNLEILVCKAY